MKLVLCSLLAVSAFAQRPTNPALLIPQEAPLLDMAVVADPLPLPAGVSMGAQASVAFDSQQHIFILNRGPQALAEFDAHGKFIRLFGDGLLNRAHGLLIDKADNIWVTDVERACGDEVESAGKSSVDSGDEAEKWVSGMKQRDRTTSTSPPA